MDEGTSATPPEAAITADRVVNDFVLTETLDGRIEWKMEAAEARHYPEEGVTRLTELTLRFYDTLGTEKSVLTADGGHVQDGTGDMTALGNVRVVSTEGDELTTEELRYFRTQDLISGPGFVRLSKPDRVVTGIGYEAKPDLTNYKIREDVKVTIIQPPEVPDGR